MPGLLMLLVLGGLWGATFPIARWGIHEGAAPFTLLTFALALATLVGVALGVLSRAPWPSARSLASSAALGGLLIGGNNVLLFWGVQFTTGGLASVIYATTPLIAVLASLALGASSGLRALGVGGLLVGFSGVLLLEIGAAGTTLLSNPVAFAAILGGAASQAVGTVLVSRYRPEGEGRYGQAAQFAGAAGLSGLAMIIGAGPYTLAETLPTVSSLAYFALFSVVAGYAIFFRMIHNAGAVSANLVNYLIPIVALLVGVTLLGESAGWIEGVGLAIILSGLALFELAGRRPSPRPRAPLRAVPMEAPPVSPGL